MREREERGDVREMRKAEKTKEGSQPLWMIGDYLVKESLETIGEGRDS